MTRPSCIRTHPKPILDASQNTSKGFSISGWAKTGEVVSKVRALLRTSTPKDAHWYLQYAELAWEIAMTRGLELYAGLSLSPMGATVRDMGQGYLHRPYMWPSPSFRPYSRQGRGLRGLTPSTNVKIKANQRGRIWTIARIFLLRISCNKLGNNLLTQSPSL